MNNGEHIYSGLTLVTAPTAEPVSIADVKAHSRISTALDDVLMSGYLVAARQHCENYLRRALMLQTWRLAIRHFPGRSYGSGMRDTTHYEDFIRWNHIKVPLPPLVSIVSFAYQDAAGNVFQMAQGFGNQVGNYLLDTECEPGRVVLPFSGTWPSTILLPGSPIKITFACGYSAFSGTADLSDDGTFTWRSGTKFDQNLIGTWITVDGVSYLVIAFTDDQHILLAGQPLSAGQNLAFTASLVPMALRQAILMTAAHFYENRETVLVAAREQAVEIPESAKALMSGYRAGFIV